MSDDVIATFVPHHELSLEDARSLAELGGPMSVERAAEISKLYGVDAKLTNEAGFQIGHVTADGSWSLR